MNNLSLYQDRVRDSRKILKTKLIDTKVKTFKRALDSSYNSETVVLNGNEFQALVSGIPTSPLIGKKNFSTLKENGCQVGDEIYWPTNDSYWIISEHDDTEISIFQGSMQKALYILKWKDPFSNEIYTSRACAKGPEETVITNGVKHSIMFDSVTDSLYLIVPTKAKGSELLKRYFSLMVNGKKWKIQVVDDSTNENLIFLQLMEEAFDRDTDTEDLVGGKLQNVFTVSSSLDNVSSIVLGSEILFQPTLFKNGSVVNSEVLNITVKNCIRSGNLISFNQLGLSSITVKFGDYNATFSWNIEVLEQVVENTIVQGIIGSDSIKTLSTNSYFLLNTIDGIAQSAFGTWNFDTEYFTAIEQDSNKLTIKANNKTGVTEISYLDGELVIVKSIKIVPLFGGI